MDVMEPVVEDREDLLRNEVIQLLVNITETSGK